KTGESSTKKKDQLNHVLIRELKALLDEINPLVKQFRRARDSFCNNANERFKIKLHGKRVRDGRNYNLLEADEVVALIIGDIGVRSDKRDIVVQSHEGELQRISELHVLYLALRYPLIYARGEDGYRTYIDHAEESFSRTKKKKQVTMREWLAYRIQERNNGYSLLQNSRKLYQQFLVDGYTMLESQQLFYVRREQKNLRCASYSKLSSAVNNGETSTSGLGKRIYLPSSYTGRARFMAARNLKLEDRPEVVSRVFKMKVDTLIKDLKTNKLFGRVEAVVYTVEFQKRGLPHRHICLFLHANDKLPDPKHIDRVISAKILDKFSDPELYELVSDCMMHGTCGPGHTYSPCMKDKKTCSKKFPRNFCQETTIDEDGYLVYRRCDNGPKHIDRVISAKILDKFSDHELYELVSDCMMHDKKTCSKKFPRNFCQETTIDEDGYLVYRRCDNGRTVTKSRTKLDNRATVVVVDEEVDVSSCEAAWRIFQFDIHERTLPVERLPFHLKGEQSAYFVEGSCIEDIVNNPSVNETMFTEWMEANKIYDEAKELTYVEFPTKFVWKQDIKRWRPRKKGFCLGRMRHVSPSTGDAYFFRILLNKKKGPTSWEEIRTVDNELYNTNKDACYAMGLLDDDKEYIDGITKARLNMFGNVHGRCWQRIWNQFKEKRMIGQTLSAAIRHRRDIVLNVASSGITTRLLPGGRTTYSRFAIPINVNKDSKCCINIESDLAGLIRKTKLIIWDEAPMVHKHCFEALDRTLKDIMRSSKLFGGNNNSESEKTKAFADWILSIDNDAIINAIYPDVVANLSTPGYFEDRAILAPTIDVVNKINERMMKLITTEKLVWSSKPQPYIKKGVLVMLLRNVDQQAGLCDGTRLLIRRMGLHVVEAEIITGTNVGDITFIPRMRLNSSDKRMPLQFYRRQFPLAVCFAMTINKSQRQSLSQVGLFLERPVFSHGQLYVALSRVRSKKGLRVVICDKEGQSSNTTTNDTKNELPDPLDVDTSNLKLLEFDIEVMQREIDDELKAEQLKNLMAWKWDAIVDLSKDVLIFIDDESNVEVADYKESFVVKETQGDTIDDNEHRAKRARMDELYSFTSEKDNIIPASKKTEEK
nr:uncharacterized protein [Tanacetum cinerariifolium]